MELQQDIAQVKGLLHAPMQAAERALDVLEVAELSQQSSCVATFWKVYLAVALFCSNMCAG